MRRLTDMRWLLIVHQITINVVLENKFRRIEPIHYISMHIQLSIFVSDSIPILKEHIPTNGRERCN
jgi:hypothetical protein